MVLKAENYIDYVIQAKGYYSKYPVSALLTDNGGQLYNVKSTIYGAKGDGTTDDTIAIQAALNAANAAGGGIVYLPSSTYIINVNGLNVNSNTILRGTGPSSIIKLQNGANNSGNLVKAQSVSNVRFDSFAINGNAANQASGTNYGAYFGSVTNGSITNLYVSNCTGDGIHVYNSTGIKVLNNWSTANTFHGFECEQDTQSTWQNNRSYSNTLHGIIINPGEVSGTGSQGVSIIGNICDSNGQYGIAAGVANGDTSQHLSTDCVISDNTIRNNSQYGIQIYQQNGFTITNNNISGNGFFGIYLYQTRYNNLVGNRLHNNSQSSNNAYDEIFIEGNDNGYAALNNIIANNTILIDGVVKARYAINEQSSSDGPNVIAYNNIPNAGATGTINQLVPSDVVTSPGGVLQIGNNGQAIQGANGGLDSAFSNTLRIYNNFTSGNTQIVTPNGSMQVYAGGNNNFNVGQSSSQFQPGTSTTPGGALMYTLGTSGPNVYAGSGAPTVSAPQGSLYLRTDGSTSSTRMYINTNGSTVWTNVTTGA